MWFSRQQPPPSPNSDDAILPVGDATPVWLKLSLACVFLAQMLTVPFLADIDKAGKLYFFSLFVLGSGIYSFKTRSLLRVSPIFVVFGIFWLLLLLSASQAFFPGWAFLQSGILLICLFFMLLVCHAASTAPSFKEELVDMLLVLGVVAALFGLYDFYCFTLSGPSRDMLIPYLLPPNRSARVGGFYGQPNLFAVLLSVALLAFYYRYLHPLKKAIFVLPAWLRFVPVILLEFVFFLTGSKGGFLSRSLILLFFLWLIFRKSYLADSQEGKKEFFRLLLCLGFAFLLSKAVSWQFTAIHLSRGELLGQSSSARFIFWTASVLIFADHPFLGVGLDNWKFLQNSYGPLAHDLLGFVPYEAMGNTNWAHNELLQILAEGGISPFLILLVLIVLLLLQIFKKFARKNNTMPSPAFFYSHLFLLPFIIQSMFEWPFRYPALLILFFLLVGNLLAQYPLFTIHWSRPFRFGMVALCILSLGFTGVLLGQEIHLKRFLANLHSDASVVFVEKTLPEFEILVNNSYSRHRVLLAALPRYTRIAWVAEKTVLAEKILPYAEELAALEGARWQWYSLAQLYLKVGREEDARRATQKTIDLMPSDDRAWAFMHYLNIRKASEETGRPIEEFVPQGRPPPATFSPAEMFNERL